MEILFAKSLCNKNLFWGVYISTQGNYGIHAKCGVYTLQTLRKSKSLTNSTNLHSRTSKGPKCRLSTRTWSLGFISSSSTELDMKSSDAKFLNGIESQLIKLVKTLGEPSLHIKLHKYLLINANWKSKNHSLKKWIGQGKTLHLCATSCAASMAAYGEDSSLSAFTFMPPTI